MPPDRQTALRFSLETPDGAHAFSLDLPAELTLGALVGVFLSVDDQAIDAAAARSADEGAKVTCRAGCAHCCRQLVPLSAPEAFHLADTLGARADAAATAARFAAVHDALERSWIGYALRHQLAADERRATELALGWHRLGHACPLLVDERCSAYETRPVVCREYLVTTPVDGCVRPGTAPLRRVPLSLRLSDALATVAGERLGPAFARTVPLPSALAFASEHRGEGARCFPAEALVRDLLAALRT